MSEGTVGLDGARGAELGRVKGHGGPNEDGVREGSGEMFSLKPTEDIATMAAVIIGVTPTNQIPSQTMTPVLVVSMTTTVQVGVAVMST